jgi:predicted amino acid racemase
MSGRPAATIVPPDTMNGRVERTAQCRAAPHIIRNPIMNRATAMVTVAAVMTNPATRD